MEVGDDDGFSNVPGSSGGPIFRLLVTSTRRATNVS